MNDFQIASPIMVVPPATQTSKQVSLCVPQISQLDGMDDRQPANTAASGSYLKRRSNFDGGRVNTKKKWMVDKESRQQLKASIEKARMTVTDRLYQKEVKSFVSVFLVSFSAPACIKVYSLIALFFVNR